MLTTRDSSLVSFGQFRPCSESVVFVTVPVGDLCSQIFLPKEFSCLRTSLTSRNCISFFPLQLLSNLFWQSCKHADSPQMTGNGILNGRGGVPRQVARPCRSPGCWNPVGVCLTGSAGSCSVTFLSRRGRSHLSHLAGAVSENSFYKMQTFH